MDDKSLPPKLDAFNHLDLAQKEGDKQGREIVKHEIIRNLILDTDFADDKIARLTCATVDVVQKIRLEEG